MMATLYCGEQKNNLELYLNDVYEKECVFKIEQEEVEFIQTGIETLVQDLVDQILAYDSFDQLISDEIDKDINMNLLKEKIYNKKNIVEVYFPIQSDCSLQRHVAENASYIKTVKSTIIKVGSFYDGTKNNFPDEFDFIFLLLGLRKFQVSPSFPFYLLKNHFRKTTDIYGMFLHYTSLSENHQVTRKLDFEKFIGRHGPAFKVQFIYSNGFGEQRPIHVDLVPAFKIINSNTQQMFVEKVRNNVEPKTIREGILSVGSCLLVYDLTFTEIEQHFMKNILSQKHVKVTRILKHLLNGNGDGEKLNEYLSKKVEVHYTSYRIKILMIYHHEVCTNTDTGDVGPYVLQVLKKPSKYKSPDSFPEFTVSLLLPGAFCVLPYLKSTTTTLQSMQTSENSYNYERDKIKSVSRQYLDSVALLEKIRQSCVML
ncbi:uncharacterized protein LOC123539366 [Mercenaria mercenaria]|uniref:uncharacterized protein LOC123539366 n=1 Tax=Mercenaria mercenaria TaxID=6596 RepID=UPI00234EFD32|nr:uncharacterized protein LOC123539366 [Mercenaria mercenaria]